MKKIINWHFKKKKKKKTLFRPISRHLIKLCAVSH